MEDGNIIWPVQMGALARQSVDLEFKCTIFITFDFSLNLLVLTKDLLNQVKLIIFLTC